MAVGGSVYEWTLSQPLTPHGAASRPSTTTRSGAGGLAAASDMRRPCASGGGRGPGGPAVLLDERGDALGGLGPFLDPGVDLGDVEPQLRLLAARNRVEDAHELERRS